VPTIHQVTAPKGVGWHPELERRSTYRDHVKNA
jgi:hypothetical protein